MIRHDDVCRSWRGKGHDECICTHPDQSAAIISDLKARNSALVKALEFIALRAGRITQSHFNTNAEYDCWCEAYRQARSALDNATA